ncbi:hypothetical protein [Carboxylicivirga taeanensis]|uniref:hypothetical protein n=1 Tax=Carboxylicivirga taeanensis TaxID=1416875 RepID=UPI003F6E0B82
MKMLTDLTKLIVIVLGIVTITTACSKEEDEFALLEKKKIFSVVDDQTILLNGVINSKSLNEFNELYEKNPGVKQVNIQQCDGSINDEVNLELSKRVHELGLSTHLMDNGLIASGGVDFFLAGLTRTAGKNTKIGVHAWADGGKTAKDFPKGHAYHQSYIDYYKAIGFSNKEAEDFYYFTISAAPADKIHWMTTEEIVFYKLLVAEYTLDQLQGTWLLTSSTDTNHLPEVEIIDNVLNFGAFKKVSGQWSWLAPDGMNSFAITLKNNILSGRLMLSNGAIDRYRALNLNKEMIDLAEAWSKQEREIFQVLSVDAKQLVIKALSRDGQYYFSVTLTKK